jgi:hypothetical protein
MGHVLERRCVVCGTVGCDRCTHLHYVTSSRPVKGSISGSDIGENQEGCCSPACYQSYWEGWVSRDPSMIDRLPYIPVFSPAVFDAHVHRMVHSAKLPSAGHIQLLQRYHDRPLAQGIIIMYNGFKDLDHSKVTDGLRLCRNDPSYERIAKAWVDRVAHAYVADLKKLDVPTSRANLGGVQIALTMPSSQNQMKLHQCPSCSAQMDTIAFRGQVVRCSFCGSTFEIT